MRGSRGAALATAAAISLSAGLVPVGTQERVEASERYEVRRRWIAPGLRLLRIKDNRGPNQIRVLKLNPASASTLHMELAAEQIPGHEPTSSMAARNGAIAAINGDFTLLPTDKRAGRPVHTFAEDAELITSPLLYGRNFAQTADEATVYIGHPEQRAWATQQDSGETWEVNHWNQLPIGPESFGVYTMAGGSNHPPPRNACAARLYPASEPSFSVDRGSTEQLFTVSAVKCSSTRMGRQGGTVIAARFGSAAGTDLLADLVAGETMSLGWTTGWPNVNETIGGNPTLLEQGLITADRCTDSYFCYRNPRTGIGIDGRGKILLVTVDGRRKRSVGMTPIQFAKLFRWLGSTSALNLDGGGSTTMWVRGKIVNVPSGGYERPVGSSVLIVPEPEAEPSPTPFPSPSEIESFSLPDDLTTTELRCDALRDPASTGGLVDYLSKRNPHLARRPALQETLEIFRGDRPCRLAAAADRS